jgi:serine/threonine-protein phosphatase 2B catalytic subunit
MDLLPDPKKDRMVKHLKPPPHKPLNGKLLWPEKSKSKKKKKRNNDNNK